MVFRKADKSDIDAIICIIKHAQQYLKEQKIEQWQNNYPNIETIKSDIKNGNGYVLTKDGITAGTVAVVFGAEETYENIYGGKWISDREYATIHRIAVSAGEKGKGLASVILGEIEKMCLNEGVHSIRVDTHRENIPMQRLLQRNGFQYCGVIYLGDGSERIAFEKAI